MRQRKDNDQEGTESSNIYQTMAQRIHDGQTETEPNNLLQEHEEE